MTGEEIEPPVAGKGSIGFAVRRRLAGLQIAEVAGYRYRCFPERLLQEIQRRQAREDDLRHLALHDHLTGLPDRVSADRGAATDVLHDLAELGVHISVDDFGTGYGSLVYLSSLPINAIKIDRQFIQAAPTTTEAATIVSALVGLARMLDLRVVGEGIETAEQLEFLRRQSCQLAEGYWFSYPLGLADLECYLQNKA